MKPTSLRFLAVSSLLLSVCASAATRPHYGGNLRLLMQAAPASLDPTAGNANDSAIRNIAPLIFDTLVKLDDRGAAQPALADSWQLDPANHSWQIHLRRGVTFSDGLVLTPQIAAASLLAANSSWKVTASGDSITMQCDPDDEHDLPALLTLPRNSIVERINGNLIGTGPFTIAKWEPGKELVLTARKDYWDGRTFLDSITIEMNQTPRAQLLAFDLHQSDMIEIEPDQVRRAIAEGREVEQSKPAQLLALVFTNDSQPNSAALASSIDRNSLNELLQGAGSPAGGLLPNWISGYEFVFPSAFNLENARQQRNLIKGPAKLTLSYDPADRAMLLVAQRIALNARDAGITVQISPGGAADARLVRADLISANLVSADLISLDPHIALRMLAQTLGLPLPQFKQYSLEDLYSAENQLIQSQRIIPLLHLRTAIAIQANVHDVDEQPDGSFDLKNAWLETAQP